MAEEYAAKPRIEIEGNQLAAELDVRLERAVVDDHLFLPDMFVLRFRDPERALLKQAGFKVGAGVRVLASPLGREASEPLIAGEVTAVSLEVDASGSHAVVLGYDHSHRLHRGRRTETYRDVTDSDLARKVAKRIGVPTGRIDETTTRHKHVSQANLTDWEFLGSRANEIGFEVAVVDGKLEFRRPADAGKAPATGDLNSSSRLQLVLGANLEEFRPRLTSAEQVKEVEVRGWDPQRKQALVGRAPARTLSAVLSGSSQPITPAALAREFGDPTFVSVDRALSSQAEVDAAAKALAEQIASAFAEAEGVAKGDPRLSAGTAVSIGLTGEPFEGRYTLSATRHVFDAGGYKTHFVVSGRQERSLLGLASLGATNGFVSAGGPPIYGLVIGQVTDVRDPDDLGRVKLKFPWLSATYESDWARVLQPGAGKERGFQLLPEVNDEVLVAFDHGDIRTPYVLGGLFNGVDRARKSSKLLDGSTGAVDLRWFMSRLGHQLSFSDGRDGGGVLLATAKEKQALTLDAANSRVRITSDGEIVIEAGGPVTIKAGGTMALEADGELSLKAPQVKVQGDTGVELKSGAAMKVEGAQVSVKGSASAEIEGGGLCSVKAALVKIN